MRITNTRDRSIIPLHDFVQQAHQIRVGDQRANFRFVDRHEIEVGFEMLHNDAISSEVENGATRLRSAQDDQLTLQQFNFSTWRSSIPEGIKIEPVVRR